MLVIDATVALSACGNAGGFEEFHGEGLVGPPLIWSEARSVLREFRWRGDILDEDAQVTRSRLERCPVARRSPPRLGTEAWGSPTNSLGKDLRRGVRSLELAAGSVGVAAPWVRYPSARGVGGRRSPQGSLDLLSPSRLLPALGVTLCPLSRRLPEHPRRGITVGVCG